MSSLWNLPLAVHMPEIQTPVPAAPSAARPFGRYGVAVTAEPANDAGCEPVVRCACCGTESSDDVFGSRGWQFLRRGAVLRQFCPQCPPKGNALSA